MIPELGQFALILAFTLSVLLSIIPLWGAYVVNHQYMSLARPLAVGVFTFMLMSFGCLAYAFMSDDFSVSYVVSHSNTQLPIYYKISAVWGGHEGSLLLWVLILSGWMSAVAWRSRNLPLPVIARVLSVMGLITAGFTLFAFATSSPFIRILEDTPENGQDLNPLLQDIGLILHPPILYMGYVGFSVAFAFAIAALLTGKLDAAWARWIKPWTLIAWAFLTLGIALGSWWAYYELGWGGWWFWDPVENASFMPWLVGTALIHSLSATEKRGVFKSWTVLLAIFAFSLSLLGTFLVRSGVLTSVHAFAADPQRGYFVLVLLAISVGGSLLLYAVKASDVAEEDSFDWLSRETFILINNVLLVVICLTVLLGTLYPLIIDVLNMGKISVGAPYFNTLFVPLTLLLSFFLAVGSITRWKASLQGFLIKRLAIAAAVSSLMGVLLPYIASDRVELLVVVSWILSLWVFSVILLDVIARCSRSDRESLSLLNRISALPRQYFAMQLAHLGLAVAIIGVAMVSHYSEQQDVRMAPGDSINFAGYRFVFDDAKMDQASNYKSYTGVFLVYKDEDFYKVMQPEKRYYTTRGSLMTEAEIDAGFWQDLYLVMGEPLHKGAWAIRLQSKPYVRWIWLGAIMMAIGGFWSASATRYRKKRQKLGYSHG